MNACELHQRKICWRPLILYYLRIFLRLTVFICLKCTRVQLTTFVMQIIECHDCLIKAALAHLILCLKKKKEVHLTFYHKCGHIKLILFFSFEAEVKAEGIYFPWIIWHHRTNAIKVTVSMHWQVLKLHWMSFTYFHPSFCRKFHLLGWPRTTPSKGELLLFCICFLLAFAFFHFIF